VSGQYAASSSGEGGKFLAALTIQEQLSTIQKEHWKVQYQNNEAQDTNKNGAYKKKIPAGARFFAYVQTGPEAHPASCKMGTGSFPGVKRPGCGADHPPPPSAEIENEESHTCTPPLGLWWPVIGWPLTFQTLKLVFLVLFTPVCKIGRSVFLEKITIKFTKKTYTETEKDETRAHRKRARSVLSRERTLELRNWWTAIWESPVRLGKGRNSESS
jgi:hypothetical protein